MATPKRTPGSRPTGRSTSPSAGRSSGRATGRSTGRAPGRTTEAATKQEKRRPLAAKVVTVPQARTPRRSRFTGRAMVMVMVLSVLTISYASSLKAYFQQRTQLQQLKSQIASSESGITSLQSEKDRWQDPAYLKEQARARFGYLMPGQTSYVVIGADGKPLQTAAKLSDPRTSVTKTPTAWWTTEWASVELAGNPPSQKKQAPLAHIGAQTP